MPDRKDKGLSARSTADSASRHMTPKTPMQRSIDGYVGARLRRLREALGMALSEVGAEIGTPADSVARYERGEQRASPADLIALAEMYDVGLRELFPDDPGQITYQLH